MSGLGNFIKGMFGNDNKAQNKPESEPVAPGELATVYSQSPDYLKAKEYYEAGDYDNADECINREHDIHPDSPYAGKLKAEILAAAGKTDSARQLMLWAIGVFENQGNECDEYYDAIESVLSEGFWNSTIAKAHSSYPLANKLVKKSPTATNFMYQGWFADFAGRHDLSVESYRRAMACKKGDDGWPSDDQVLCLFIYPSHLRAGEIDKAKAALAEAEERFPDSVFLHYVQAYELDREGRTDEAIDMILAKAYSKAADEEETNFSEDILKNIAIDHHDLVIRKIEAFAEGDDASPAALRLAYNMSAYTKATDFFRIRRKMLAKGIKIGEDAPLFESIAYYSIGAYDKALEQAEAAVKYSEKEKWEDGVDMAAAQQYEIYLRCLAAACQADAGDVDSAEAALRDLKKVDPTNPVTYFFHAVLLAERTNRGADIVKQAKAALALFDEPFSYGTHTCLYHLMKAHLQLGNTTEAQAYAQKIIEMEAGRDFFEREPYDEKPLKAYLPDLHTDKGECELYAPIAYAIMGKRKEAEAAINHMLCLSPMLEKTLCVNLITAAEACSILGMGDKAMDYVRKALHTGVFDLSPLEGNFMLEPLRQRDDWAAAMEEYKARHAKDINELVG